MKRSFAMYAGLAIAALSGSLARVHAEDTNRPNIVFIVADDLGWGDVGWHGSEIKTPNLDKLASQGAKLEAFYVQPVCTPTRAAFLTGRYPIRHGLQVGVVRPWAQYGLPLEEQTLAQGLKTAGYTTAIVGKWHLGHVTREYLPTQRGFDHQYGHYNGAIDYFTHVRDGGHDWHRDDKVNKDEGYSTHLLATEATQVVRENAGKTPFFLYVPFNAVHAPHQVPEAYTRGYEHLQGDRKIYAGMLTALDEGVGKIVAAVEAAGVRDNTLFVFTSDNGGPQPGVVTSNGKLRAGKATHYEGGVRVAAFATWDGHIPAGSTVGEPLHIADWYPTLLKLAGAKVEQKLPLDGRDAWGTITQGLPSPHDEILINATPYSGAIRVGKWKLVVNGEKATAGFDGEAIEPSGVGRQLELFDLVADPNEQSNLASKEPSVAEDLLRRWKRYQEQAVAPKSAPKGAGFRSPEVWGEANGPKATQGSLGNAPRFEGLDENGQVWKSEEHLGKKTIVVYFYPGDFTPGCTKQACAYRELKSQFRDLDVEVVGISADYAATHHEFKKAYDLDFTLLSDPDGKIAQAFGVPYTSGKKSYVSKLGDSEKTFERDGTSKRWTFVIDPSSQIIHKGQDVKPVEDASDILKLVGKRDR